LLSLPTVTLQVLTPLEWVVKVTHSKGRSQQTKVTVWCTTAFRIQTTIKLMEADRILKWWTINRSLLVAKRLQMLILLKNMNELKMCSKC